MQEDIIKVFCLAHGVSFTMPRSNQALICTDALANHVLSDDFPNSGNWFYCCQCHTYWVAAKGQGGFLRQCPSCGLIKNPRYYSCDQCNVTMMDSWGATNQRDVSITPWGAPHPHCPGCYQLPKSISQSHTCSELNGLLTTARAECPFCEVEEKVEFDAGIAESKEICLQPDSKSAVIFVTLPSGVELLNGIETGASDLFLEEIERKTAEVRALKTEAEAREAKAQERLRQAEIRLQQEISIRSEAEQKSKDIEEELRQRLEMEQAGSEIVSITSETIAEIEAEREARFAAEQAKAEAEARFREMEARACEAEERCRQAETGLQQEVAKRTLAEERASKIEIEFNRNLELAQAEFETGIAKLKAEAQSSEESIVEARVQEVEAKARQAEENYKVEIAEIRADLEATSIAANQSEANARRQYQTKVEEAIASAQAAMFTLEETQKKLIEAEAKYRETEARARQAETRSRQVYLISRLSFAFIDQIFGASPQMSDEKGGLVIPPDFATNAYLDKFFSEAPESDTNGSMDYGDFSLPDKLKAMVEVLTGAQAFDDEGNDNGMSLGSVKRAPNQDAIPASSTSTG